MSEIKPALPAEEWAKVLENEMYRIQLGHELMRATLRGEKVPGIPRPDLALVALILHKHPAGVISWEDVDALRGASSTLGSAWGDGLLGFVDRIAALLPPRDNG